MKPVTKYLLIILILGSSLGIGLYSSLLKNKPSNSTASLQHSTYLYDQKVSIADFNFSDHNNQNFSRENILGKWTFWFFGFTNCPDICPITLGTLSATVNKIESEYGSDNIRIVFVSIDPERDNPDQLKTYVSAFGNKVIGLSAQQDDLNQFLKNMGVIAVKRTDENSSTEYSFDHSSQVFLIAPDSGISAIFRTPHTPAGFTEDFIIIRDNYPTNE